MTPRLLDLVVRLLPPKRRDLGKALLAEAAMVPRGRRRISWLLGGFWFALKEGAMRGVGYGLGLAVAATVLVGIDRVGTSDDSSQVSLLVLLVGAAILGFVSPRWAWLAGLVLGSALALSSIVAVTLWPTTARPPSPGGMTGAATLFVLVVPAMVAAYAGAGVHWLWRRRS